MNPRQHIKKLFTILSILMLSIQGIANCNNPAPLLVLDGIVGGIHHFKSNYGALFTFTEAIMPAIAHEQGHKFNLSHTFSNDFRSTVPPKYIPKSGTRHNFMDYEIPRKNWFKYQILERLSIGVFHMEIIPIRNR